MAWESMHIHHSPPFLGAKTIRTTQGLKLSRISPYPTNPAPASGFLHYPLDSSGMQPCLENWLLE